MHFYATMEFFLNAIFLASQWNDWCSRWPLQSQRSRWPHHRLDQRSADGRHGRCRSRIHRTVQRFRQQPEPERVSTGLSLGGWHSDTSIRTFQAGESIPAYGHFLLVHTGKDVGVTPDATFGTSMAAKGGGLAINTSGNDDRQCGLGHRHEYLCRDGARRPRPPPIKASSANPAAQPATAKTPTTTPLIFKSWPFPPRKIRPVRAVVRSGWRLPKPLRPTSPPRKPSPIPSSPPIIFRRRR